MKLPAQCDCEILCDGISQRGGQREHRSAFENLIADGAALGGITVEQRFALALAAMDEGKFPGEVEGILHAGVHALSAGGAVDVGGIAGEHDTAAAVIGNLAFVNAETGEPHGIDDCKTAGRLSILACTWANVGSGGGPVLAAVPRSAMTRNRVPSIGKKTRTPFSCQ